LTAKELGAINVTLSSHAPDQSDRVEAKEIYKAVRTLINPTTDHFEDGEVELSVPQRALLMKLIPQVPWLVPQLIDFVDPLLIKLATT
jgi:hypothetical protein